MLDPNVGGEYLILQILGNKMEEKTFMRKRLHLKKNLKIEPIKVLFRENNAHDHYPLLRNWMVG